MDWLTIDLLQWIVQKYLQLYLQGLLEILQRLLLLLLRKVIVGQLRLLGTHNLTRVHCSEIASLFHLNSFHEPESFMRDESRWAGVRWTNDFGAIPLLSCDRAGIVNISRSHDSARDIEKTATLVTKRLVCHVAEES